MKSKSKVPRLADPDELAPARVFIRRRDRARIIELSRNLGFSNADETYRAIIEIGLQMIDANRIDLHQYLRGQND